MKKRGVILLLLGLILIGAGIYVNYNPNVISTITDGVKKLDPNSTIHETYTFGYTDGSSAVMEFVIEENSLELVGKIRMGINQVAIYKTCSATLTMDEVKKFGKIWTKKDKNTIKPMDTILREYCAPDIVFAELDEVPSQYLNEIKKLDYDNDGKVVNREKAYYTLTELAKD